MFSFAEGDIGKGKYLQLFFINNLIRDDVRGEVLQRAALESTSPRPMFGRWQLLALMKQVLLESRDEGEQDPRYNLHARHSLGEACLMLNDLLFPAAQMARLKKREGAEESERIHDELMTQWLPQFELYHVPDVYQAIARNDEYFSIFERSASFNFSQETLGEKFAKLTGLEIRQYLRLYFALQILHDDLRQKHPAEINANPSIINFGKETVFALLDLNVEERDVFFTRVLSSVTTLAAGVKRDGESERAWQFDFTTFRDQPLVFNSGSKQGFTCIAFPFLIEKLASGIYHTILNSWPEGHPERADFQSRWGKVFEIYVNDRLREEFPATLLADRLHVNPFFHKKKNSSIEVSDAVISYGDCLILLEHKGGYLSIDEKYSDDVPKLLGGVAEKFGKAVNQLSRSIGLLFNDSEAERDTFSERKERRQRAHLFPFESLKNIRKVYPVLDVQDFPMATGLMNRRLKMQLSEKLVNFSIMPGVYVKPLSVVTVENLENILEHLDEISLTEVLDEYSSERHEPLDTFNEILDQYLHKKGFDTKRRYKWSVKRGAEIVNSISQRFKVGVATGQGMSHHL